MELQNYYEVFRQRNVEILAIAVQDIQRAALMTRIIQADFPILTDRDHLVSEMYGVFNLLDDNLAAPAVYIIDPPGIIRWYYIGQDDSDWVAANTILEHLP